MMRWLKNLFKKKKREPIYVDDEYLVQDWRGYVMSQEEHRRMWNFEGYPATHGTECTCIRCGMATINYITNTGYINFDRSNPPTRRRLYDYLNNLHQGIKREEDFLPKKKMKVHKLDQHIRKETFVSPGVYTREGDYSVIVLNRRNRDE